jgi:uncharacterized membrane protein YphA (DoxX/SURF4 family)
MNASTMADRMSGSLDMPSWKSTLSHVSAFLIALIFISSGVWKITAPFMWARGLVEFLVPNWLSLPFTLALGVGETLGGVMILVPHFRRWGSLLTSLLLVSFMLYIGFHYPQLVGKDCSCFPIVKRTVGPAFFVGDGVMLLLAIVAGLWGRPVYGRMRSAAVMLGAVLVFSGASYGMAAHNLTGTKAPDSILVDGKPFSLQDGRVFLFFYDPECGHCNAAAKHMGQLTWKSDVKVVGIPVRMPQFAEGFLHDNKFKAVTSDDLAKLKAVFPFPGDPPYGVALDNGREIGPVAKYDDDDPAVEPAATLRQLGFVE